MARARPSISLALRFPATYLFLYAWATELDFSSLVRHYVLTRHRGLGWWLS